ncbi:hypothetical protein EJ04DRAFT_523524 [Polyplosphaeria fusca]|uniref:Uncharacterized protein n=1 Tax=Polyplosphaeria fusca TaxID=682080 RepID=A0A9P4QZY0_9PLEO|nr:hypothetical protein EJ04DRAFT_523524 [Polyplosphaeria fusca]
MDINDRIPYRLGTSKLPPLPIGWKIVGEHFPPKVQEARGIVKEYFEGKEVSLLYIHCHGKELCWYSPVRGVYWPTIVITARDIGKESWCLKKIPAIKQFVKDQGLDLELVLLVLDQMPAHPEGEFDKYRNEFSHDVYKGFREIGRSLGIQNVNGSVSLGCRILMEDGHQFGVTSCRRFQQGAGLTQTGLVGLNIQTPSSHDDPCIKEYLSIDDQVEHLQPRDLGKIVAMLSRSLLTDWCLFELDWSEFIWKDPKVWAQVKDSKIY